MVNLVNGGNVGGASRVAFALSRVSIVIHLGVKGVNAVGRFVLADPGVFKQGGGNGLEKSRRPPNCFVCNVDYMQSSVVDGFFVV